MNWNSLLLAKTQRTFVTSFPPASGVDLRRKPRQACPIRVTLAKDRKIDSTFNISLYKAVRKNVPLVFASPDGWSNNKNVSFWIFIHIKMLFSILIDRQEFMFSFITIIWVITHNQIILRFPE
ncbi:hypothetical protein ACJX0J_026632 [Zea mays]